jgi:hypothetical protein
VRDTRGLTGPKGARETLQTEAGATVGARRWPVNRRRPGTVDGGRASQVSRLRALTQRASAEFLHHDGGIDERSGLLPGLISRADIALFPVDRVMAPPA